MNDEEALWSVCLMKLKEKKKQDKKLLFLLQSVWLNIQNKTIRHDEKGIFWTG